MSVAQFGMDVERTDLHEEHWIGGSRSSEDAHLKENGTRGNKDETKEEVTKGDRRGVGVILEGDD